MMDNSKEKTGTSRVHIAWRVLAIAAILVVIGYMYLGMYHVDNELDVLMPPPMVAETGRRQPLDYEKELKQIVNAANDTEEQIVKAFLNLYEDYCRQRYQPQVKGTGCTCISPKLEGRISFSGVSPPPLQTTAHAHPEVTSGHWKPRDCKPRQHIAIIIPYRDRQFHLRMFLHHMIPFLQRQLIEFTIFVTEQVSPSIFNKAYLMNVGFLEAKKLGHFDCVFFQDVDTLPEDDRNIYTCAGSPRHTGAYVSRYNYTIRHLHFVGAGTAFSVEQFEQMNGFSNKFYGWGGEDVDAYWRIVQSGMQITKYPKAVARYFILEHKRDNLKVYNTGRIRLINQRAKKVKKKGKARYVDRTDGLSSAVYNSSIERKQLFTLIQVHLPHPPDSYRFSDNSKV